MYKIYAELRDLKGVSDYQVAKATGINRSMFSDWKSGRSVPKRDRIEKIAEYFGVSPEYIITGSAEPVQTDVQPPVYYKDKKAAEAAQKVFSDPNYRVLFDAADGSTPEDLLYAAEMLRRLKGN